MYPVFSQKGTSVIKCVIFLMAFLLSISVNYTCKQRKCLYVAIFFFLLLLLLLISPLPRCREHLKFIIFFSCLISNLRIRKKMIFYRTCSGVPENKFPSSFSRYFRLRINTKDKNSLNKSLKDCPSWNVTIVFQNNFKCCGGVFFSPQYHRQWNPAGKHWLFPKVNGITVE